MNGSAKLKRLSGSTPGKRFMLGPSFTDITKNEPERSLVLPLKGKSDRDTKGHVSVRHQGGGEKRNLRKIDWLRDKYNIKAKVVAIEYDPNRSARIALLYDEDGEKRYIIAPENLNIGDLITQGQDVEIKIGNALPLKKIPIGTTIHNIELRPGQGAQIVRSAGGGAIVLSKDGGFVQIKMPSGEVRLIPQESMATIGQIGNAEWKNIVFGTAGRKRHMGIRPTVRGTAQDPRSHPHGGGEGRSGEGMNPKTPWGKPARGKKTRKKGKYSDKYIIQRRKKRG